MTGLFRLAWRIQDIQLKRPLATLTVQLGGKFNWETLIAKIGEDKKPPSGAMARVLIDHIKIDGGDIEYTDADRPDRPFKALLQSLGIEIDGLSTLPEDRGNYRISTRLPEQGGTLTFKGELGLNPLSSKGELILEGMRLSDIQDAVKPPRNYVFSAGTLTSDLRYRFAMMRNKTNNDSPSLQIDRANLRVKNFALAPRGRGTPVLELKEVRIDNADLDLAQRRIEVAGVGLSGGGKMIWKAIVNVLTKLVTAPFRALGHLLGISSDKLEAVEFDFGAATLLPPEQEKIKDIGQALTKRPALTLSVSPAYDLQRYTRAIQVLRIRRDVARQMGLTIDPDQEPGPVDTANPRAQNAVEALYDTHFDKQDGVKAIPTVPGKPKDGVKTSHADMLERLTLQIPVTDDELKRLAQARGEAVKQTLITLGKVDPVKIHVGEPVKNDDSGKVVICPVSLGAGNAPVSQPISTPAALP